MFGFVGDLVDQFTGSAGAKAAKKAAGVQSAAGERAIEKTEALHGQSVGELRPYADFGKAQLDPLSQLLTPEGQFNYLQSNPLFQLALERADRQSNNAFLAGGLKGDAYEALANNTMLTAMPFLTNQTNNLFNAAGIGQNAAGNIANLNTSTAGRLSELMTGIGNAQAGGIIGAQNARQQGLNNIMSGIGAAAGFLPSMDFGGLFNKGVPQTSSIGFGGYTPGSVIGADLSIPALPF